MMIDRMDERIMKKMRAVKMKNDKGGDAAAIIVMTILVIFIAYASFNVGIF
jgi:hypothetical protein